MINVKKFLNENSDLRYAEFNKKFITSQYPILGVRTPALKKFAKELEPEYVNLDEPLSHEEILLYGFAASNIKSEDEQLEYLENILPYIDNWGTCDAIVCSMKKLTGEKSYSFFSNLLQSDKEFDIRVGVVGLMRYFIKTDKIEEVLQSLKNIKSEKYYVKMAIAWFLAELATINFSLAKNVIASIEDKFIKTKAISKSHDSYRLTPNQKAELSKIKTTHS
ncbi:MAG: DNA alkylation repair protein [Clostridia bacterium]|nr:DNA alkylation repair protein [Clostridia bacterium]